MGYPTRRQVSLTSSLAPSRVSSASVFGGVGGVVVLLVSRGGDPWLVSVVVTVPETDEAPGGVWLVSVVAGGRGGPAGPPVPETDSPP